MEQLEIKGETAEERANWLKSILTEAVCNVTFTKLNGEIRTMPCTLDYRRMPPIPVTESHPSVREVNLDTMRVWCVDIKEWRSFRVMNVTEVKVDKDANKELNRSF